MRDDKKNVALSNFYFHIEVKNNLLKPLYYFETPTYFYQYFAFSFFM